jgi:hypothetical protein
MHGAQQHFLCLSTCVCIANATSPAVSLSLPLMALVIPKLWSHARLHSHWDEAPSGSCWGDALPKPQDNKSLAPPYAFDVVLPAVGQSRPTQRTPSASRPTRCRHPSIAPPLDCRHPSTCSASDHGVPTLPSAPRAPLHICLRANEPWVSTACAFTAPRCVPWTAMAASVHV